MPSQRQNENQDQNDQPGIWHFAKRVCFIYFNIFVISLVSIPGVTHVGS